MKKRILLASLFSILFSSTTHSAMGGQINFEGAITEPPCNITFSHDSQNKQNKIVNNCYSGKNKKMISQILKFANNKNLAETQLPDAKGVFKVESLNGDVNSRYKIMTVSYL